MVPVDDGFGIMVVSGYRRYMKEPVDVVLVVTGRVLYVVVSGPLHVWTVLWWWFVVGASSSMISIVLLVVVA